MFICIILFCIFYVRSDEYPDENNLDTYIDAIKRVSQFYTKNRDLINVNSLFALFITNVNIKHILDYNKDNTFLLQKTSIKKDMKYIFESNNKLIKYFRKSAQKRKLPYEHRAILTLLGNMSTVTKRLYQFKPNLKVDYAYTQKSEASYSKWKNYRDKIFNFEKTYPTPYLSNTCLTTLAEYPMNMKKELLGCSLDKKCNTALQEGENSGFSLSHRILWLVMAHIGRGCTILSSQEDNDLMEKLCLIAIKQSSRNAGFDFRYDLGDLVQEFMCTCALAGYTEFLKKYWFNVTLKYQTFFGCFHVPGNLIGSDESTRAIDMCDHHTTSVSVCSLAVAARFIIENYNYYPFE